MNAPPRPSQDAEATVSTHIAQLNAACALVLARTAPAVTITCPKAPQARGLAVLATRIAARHGLRASMAADGTSLTVRISHPSEGC